MKSKLMQLGLLSIAVIIIWKVGEWSSALDPRSFMSPTQAVLSTNTSRPTATRIITTTNTPSPSRNLTPTTTNTPVFTKTPTIAPTYTPTTSASIPFQVTNLYKNAKIISYDDFNTFDPTFWSDPGLNVRVSNNMLEFTTSTTEYTMRRKQTFKEGSGVLLDFKYSNEIAGFEFAFSGGTYKDPNYRLFGISRDEKTGIQKVSIAKGTEWQGVTPAWTRSTVWYRLFMGISKGGDMVVLVWEKDKPESWGYFFRVPIGKDSRNMDWRLFMRGQNEKNQVTVSWADYFELDLNE